MRVLVERINAVLQQVTSIQVVIGRPLEQLAPGLLDDEVVVRGKSDVARLTNIADPGVLLLVATADVRGAIGRGVIRDDQLKILVALAQQSIKRFGEVVRTVVDRKADGQPG